MKLDKSVTDTIKQNLAEIDDATRQIENGLNEQIRLLTEEVGRLAAECVNRDLESTRIRNDFDRYQLEAAETLEARIAELEKMIKERDAANARCDALSELRVIQRKETREAIDTAHKAIIDSMAELHCFTWKRARNLLSWTVQKAFGELWHKHLDFAISPTDAGLDKLLGDVKEGSE